MLAIDPRLPLSLTTGLLAAINPCGFVLLPTYLLYFLGVENLRPGGERASISRGLLVGGSVSAGFMSVFVVLGVVTKWFTFWFTDKAPYISLGLGVGLVILGITMIFGLHLPFAGPKMDLRGDGCSVRRMYLFGIAYAVASLGCTLPGFMATVLGAITTKGIALGVAAIALYGLGMAMLVTGLTVALAMANTAMLRFLRRGMPWFEYLAGIAVLLTGLYLAFYWYEDVTDRSGESKVVQNAVGWQERLSRTVESHRVVILTAAAVLIVGAVAMSLRLRRVKHATEAEGDRELVDSAARASKSDD